jgi:8-oxo-dGTP diphosphatase
LKRDVRFQGAIIRDDHILLIRHKENATGRTYWIIPGGGQNEGESPEDCVRREMKEETGLDVAVKEFLFDEPQPTIDSTYRRYRTYLCEPVTGEAKPGSEPEAEAALLFSIVEVKWFDLRDESGWDPEMLADPFTYPIVQRLRQKLGYLRKD